MPTERPAAVTSERLRYHDRPRRKDGGQSKPSLRASHPRSAATAAKCCEDEINRLKEIICALQAERQQQRSREEEGDRLGVVGQEPRGPEQLRWRVNQLERDKLELTSKHNEQVSSLEGQVARLRAAVERGEAQRQTLEYDMAVVRKEAGVERSNLQENMAALCSQNEQLMELQQRVCVLQKALEITRMAREEDQHALQQEVEERDGLVLSANTENDQLTAENKHLHTLLQDQEETLQELKRRMGEVQRERERDGEALRRQTSELGYITEREERMKKELETALQRVKTLETNIESERAAHLESKFNSEIIQLRIRDLEAALQVEKCSQAEAVSSLDMVKQQFREVERAYSIERDRARDSTGRLAQLEKDYLSSKAELSAELEKERRTASQVRDQLQELHTLHTHSLTQLDMARKRQVLLEEEFESYLRELQQLLQLHTAVGQLTTEEPVGEGRKHSPSTVMNMLGTTLTTYQTTLDQTTTEVLDQQKQSERLFQEVQSNQRLMSEQKSHLEELRAALSDCNVELQRLRSQCSEKTLQTNRLQTDLQTAQQHWEREREREKQREGEREKTREKQREGEREKERERTVELQAEVQRIRQLNQKDSQEKLSFLHGLFQRLLAGCVLVSQPQCILGSFSWAELCDVITEHVDTLTSDLTRANERVSHLQAVCESNSVCVSQLQQSQEGVLVRIEETVKQREETWTAQRHEMDQQHTHTVTLLQGKIQMFGAQLEEARQRLSSLEKERSQLTNDLAMLQKTLTQSDLQGSTLLSACTLLAGALTHLTHATHTLRTQKTLLTRRLAEREGLEMEVRTLVQALGEGRGEGDEERKGGGVRRWRRCVVCVIAVNRLCVLGRGSRLVFRVGGQRYPSIGVRVSVVPPLEEREKASTPQSKGEEDNDDEGRGRLCVRWLRRKDISFFITSSMAELQEALEHTVSSSQVVLSAARNSLSRLLDHLLTPSDRGSHLKPYSVNKGTLVSRLGQGLHRLTAKQMSNKCLVVSLQQHFLVFTHRLHSAEVERRSLRLEVARLKRVTKGDRGPCHLVPAERFGSVCEELRQALQREEQAQGLLRQQSDQLHTLGLRMDTHCGEEREREHTLSQAVQSLSEARQEVRQKEQSLRVLGKHLSGLQQEKKSLEESVRHAEDALRMAAKRKDSLASYMRAVESSYREVRDRIVQSRSTSTDKDLPLQLPRVHLDLTGPERLLGGPDVAACQSLVGTFSELYHAAFSRIGSMEREISAHQSHVSALRKELHDACLREDLCFIPVCDSQSSMAPHPDDLCQLVVDPEAPPTERTNVLLREATGKPNPTPSLAPSLPLSDPPKKAKGSKKVPKKTRSVPPKAPSRR
ncbi:coiled-coil domain-containing protein 171 isoform X1 [Oncorhynchus clarkii lewisi]|uniref:coiled-coil domain-containing protein 171 isoform X1 n=1 Tax=Oncorhynchus clarkii lewisi TaxID=490388 RepID=UPI0039B87A96